MNPLPSSSKHKARHPSSRPRGIISPHPSSGPTSAQVDGPYKVQKMGKMRTKRRKILSSTLSVARARAQAIDILPDEALLHFFDFFCRETHEFRFLPVHKWQRLIHVCRRWRQIMFSSPRRLDLYLLCKPGTPVRKNLDIWASFTHSRGARPIFRGASQRKPSFLP